MSPPSAEDLLRYEYRYDEQGNRKSARLSHQGENRSWMYSYDNLNRLVLASRGTLIDTPEPNDGRYVCLRSLSEIGGRPFACIAELTLLGD